MGLLKTYENRPKDVPKRLIPAYCEEIRRFLLDNISLSGGHLASNLGVVELTVALQRVFDTASDRVIFDVGHQSYVHKLLTGRGEQFKSFRAFGGMAGFTKPQESVHDAFISGHASTSVSAALGMARARTLRGEDYRVAAVLGDGALTGGLSYEGLSDAGQSGERLVVVLNDNEMSITRSVGALASQLTRLRLKPRYFKAKRIYHGIIDKAPGGKRVDSVLTALKDMLHGAVVPGSFFEQLGFVYLGPADGHDVGQIEFLLRQAVAMRRPVLLHVTTVKGKGYSPAERSPSAYHGVGSFDVSKGCAKSKAVTFSRVFGAALTDIAAKDRRVCAITAAMTEGTGLTSFSRRFPNRFFDVGIAEGHAVTMAAGMAMQGMRPVVAVYSSFLQRSFDQILHDVGILGLNVVFAVDRAGLVGEDGETHHGLFDTRYLSCVPGLRFWAPASFAELRAYLRAALEYEGPAAIRYPRGAENIYRACNMSDACIYAGGDATVVTYGSMVNTALLAARRLKALGISLNIVKLAEIKPIDAGKIAPLCVGPVYLLEDNMGILPAAIHGTALNTGDRYVPHGKRSDLMKFCGLDAESVAARIANDLKA